MSERVVKVSLIRKGDIDPTHPPVSIPPSFDYTGIDPELVKEDIKKRAIRDLTGEESELIKKSLY